MDRRAEEMKEQTNRQIGLHDWKNPKSYMEVSLKDTCDYLICHEALSCHRRRANTCRRNTPVSR